MSVDRKRRSLSLDTMEEEYARKRAKNNEAVNKTRAKKKHEEEETARKVETLMVENEQLEKKVDSLKKELEFLKEMFVTYANGSKKTTKTDSPTPSQASASAPTLVDIPAAN